MRQAPNGIRFAPSPTGRFHVGNLRTAWISHQWSRALKEPWIVRFEDIDGPRVVEGAKERQLEDMAALGLVPDEILVQSMFHSRHLTLFKQAIDQGQVYPCYCSRKEIRAALDGAASAPHSPAIEYAGTCRDRPISAGPSQGFNLPSVGWRFRNGDFLIGRTLRFDAYDTFVPSYHWACAIDDFDGAYRLLVRAWDLESATQVQRTIQKWLSPDWNAPSVFHASLVVQNDGHRLEKRTAGVTWPELQSANVTARELLTIFERSFDGTKLLDPSFLRSEEILGETKKELRLAELGILINSES